MLNRIRRFYRVLLIPALCILLTAALASTALADTNGSEIQITDQPEKLILQLGPQWVGVEFELKTDAGVFPVPVVVDSTGVLRMDLGGSKTYTLSSLASIPDLSGPGTVSDPNATPGSSGPETTPAPEAAKNSGVPVFQLVVFLVGLTIAAGGLIAMRNFKKRREAYYDYDDDDEGDDYE